MTIARRSLILVSGVCLVVLLAVVFRSQLLAPLVVLALQQTLGVRATVGHVGGSAFGGLVIDGLSASGNGKSGPITSFDAKRISARYSLAKLLGGTKAFIGSLQVAVEGARLDLDLTSPPATQSPRERSAGLPALPQLTLTESRFLVRGVGWSLDVDGLSATVAQADPARQQAVDIRAGRVSVRHPALREGTVSVAVAGTLAPKGLTIDAARVDGEPLVERARLELGERPGDFDLQLDLRFWQGSVGVGMVRQQTGTEMRWDAKGIDLRPDRFLVNPAVAALRGRLSTRGSATLGDGGLPTLAGTLSLDWEGARIAGQTIDRLSIEGSARPGNVFVQRAEGRVGPNEVRLRQISFPTAPLIERRWRALLAASSGSVSAKLADIPALLALLGVETDNGMAAIPDHRLTLEGTVGDGHIRIARGEFTSGVGKATLDVVDVSLPHEDQGWGEAIFTGSAAVDIPSLQELSALLPMPVLGGSLRASVSGRGTLARPQGSMSLTGRGITVEGKAIGDVDLAARGTAGAIEIDTLVVRQGSNRFTAREIRFSPAALAASGRDGLLDSLSGSFEARLADIPSLAALAGVEPGMLAPLPARHLLTAAGAVRGRTISISAASFAAAGATLTLRGGRVALPSAGAAWGEGTALGGDLEIDVPDLGAAATVFRLPPLQGTLKGRARLEGSLASPAGSAEMSGRGIAFDGHRIGDVSLKASASRQRVNLETFEVTRGTDRLSGRGSYDPATHRVLGAEASLSVADVRPWFAEFVREGFPVSGSLRVGLRAAGPLPGSAIDVDADFSDGTIQTARAVRGDAKAQVSLDGTLRRPRIAAASLTARLHGETEGRPAALAIDAGYEPGRLLLRTLDLAGARGLTVHGEGSVPLDLAADAVLPPGPVTFRAQASIPALENLAFLFPPEYAVKGSLRADLAVTGSWERPEARLELSGEGLQPSADTRFAPPGPYTLAGTLAWGATEARVEKVRIMSPALSCSLSGTWTSPPPLRSLGSPPAGGVAGSLALRASFSSPDLGWLQGSVDGLRRLQGGLAGEIAVDGPAGDPVVSGKISVAGGALRFGDFPPLDALEARLTVERRVVTLEGLSGNVGGSPFTITGSADLASIRDPVLDLRLRGTNALLYRAEGLRLRADSDLTLRGPVSALSLAGEVALTDSVYQRSISVADLFSGGGKQEKTARRPNPGRSGISFPEPPLRDLRFDVRLIAREPFRIATSVLRGTARPDLSLTGTGLLPLLRGSINFNDLQLMLPSGVMEFERGSLLFRESATARTELDFGGRMQALGYEITAQVGGSLESPEVVLSSLPPLPKEELALFVISGVPPTGARGDGESVTTMATPMAVYLSKGVLERLLGSRPRADGADLQGRLEVQVGREQTKSGSTTMDARLLLIKDPVGKGSGLYLTAEKDIYDQENMGMRLLIKLK